MRYRSLPRRGGVQMQIPSRSMGEDWMPAFAGMTLAPFR